MNEIYVTMTVSYEIDAYPGVPHVAHHKFVDQYPKFPMSERLIEVYSKWDYVDIDVWHEDVPEPTGERPTHWGSGMIQ